MMKAIRCLIAIFLFVSIFSFTLPAKAQASCDLATTDCNFTTPGTYTVTQSNPSTATAHVVSITGAQSTDQFIINFNSAINILKPSGKPPIAVNKATATLFFSASNNVLRASDYYAAIQVAKDASVTLSPFNTASIKVEVFGGLNAAGIGGGYDSTNAVGIPTGKITIGGTLSFTVEATPGNYASAIGSGYNYPLAGKFDSSFESITINYSKVTTYAPANSAFQTGIGGLAGPGRSITIMNSTVNATSSGPFSPAIGSTYDSVDITIDNSTVNAISPEGVAIGCPFYNNPDKSFKCNITIKGAQTNLKASMQSTVARYTPIGSFYPIDGNLPEIPTDITIEGGRVEVYTGNMVATCSTNLRISGGSFFAMSTSFASQSLLKAGQAVFSGDARVFFAAPYLQYGNVISGTLKRFDIPRDIPILGTSPNFTVAGSLLPATWNTSSPFLAWLPGYSLGYGDASSNPPLYSTNHFKDDKASCGEAIDDEILPPGKLFQGWTDTLGGTTTKCVPGALIGPLASDLRLYPVLKDASARTATSDVMPGLSGPGFYDRVMMGYDYFFRVLDPAKDNMGLPGMFLTNYHDNEYNYYAPGPMDPANDPVFGAANADAFLVDNFNTLETGALKTSTVADKAVSIDGVGYLASPLNGQKLFPISMAEMTNTAYFPNAYNRSVGSSYGVGTPYLTRSFQQGSTTNVGGVSSYGQIKGIDPNDGSSSFYRMRFAFNLDPSKVLLSMAYPYEPDYSTLPLPIPYSNGLEAVKTGVFHDWVLTLLDDTRAFKVTSPLTVSKKIGTDVMTLPITYAGATIYDQTNAPWEYVSVLITDSAGKPLYFGRMLQPTAADGNLTLDIKMLPAGNYKVNVFSEQFPTQYYYENGYCYDYCSNSASKFSTIALTIEKAYVPPVEPTVLKIYLPIIIK